MWYIYSLKIMLILHLRVHAVIFLVCICPFGLEESQIFNGGGRVVQNCLTVSL